MTGSIAPPSPSGGLRHVVIGAFAIGHNVSDLVQYHICFALIALWR